MHESTRIVSNMSAPANARRGEARRVHIPTLLLGRTDFQTLDMGDAEVAVSGLPLISIYVVRGSRGYPNSYVAQSRTWHEGLSMAVSEGFLLLCSNDVPVLV